MSKFLFIKTLNSLAFMLSYYKIVTNLSDGYMKYNIALIGATGNVGRCILNILSKSKISVNKIFVIASQKSIGKKMIFGKKILEVKAIDGFDFKGIDLVFFATNATISKKYVEKVKQNVKLVIDLSSYYRMKEDVPLVVPEVNLPSARFTKKSLVVASPNCIAIPLVMILHPLHELASISRVIISTYQSVSGAGKKAMDNLYSQTKNALVNAFAENNQREKIAFNLIPKIDDFTETGFTKEEIKVTEETKKILSADINITCTCVRVPVFIGHSISANVEFLNNISVNKAYSVLDKSDGVITDKSSNYKYFTPGDCIGKNEIFVSRIRQDQATNNILNFWIVSDNLRKGAALNAVQIAENYITNYL